jgi:excisionase family DNA binding protein
MGVQRILKLAEVCEILSVTPKTVRRYLANGALTGFKIGREWRVKESVVNDVIEGKIDLNGGARKDDVDRSPGRGDQAPLSALSGGQGGAVARTH